MPSEVTPIKKVNDMRDKYKELVKLLQDFGANFRTSEIFRDFVELSAIAIMNQYAFDADWDKRENRYHEIRKKYQECDFNRFPELVAVLVDTIHSQKEQGYFVDVLGQLYMDLNLGNAANGQYFTPYHVCQLMSALVTQDLGEKLKTEKFVTVLEPACGSGANLIAFAESVQSHGYTPAKRMAAVGVDIDALCVWMCYLQCQLYRIPAKIVHGNSLTHEFWSAWCTSDWVHGGYAQAMAERIFDSKNEPATEAGTGVIPPKLLTLEEQLVLF